MKAPKPHAALLASPGMGHLIPILELGKLLANQQNFDVTIFVVTADYASPEVPAPAFDLVDVVTFPPEDIGNLIEPGAEIVTKLAVTMRAALPSLRSAISVMKSPPTLLIADLFGTEAFSVADEFQMLKYVFITTNAWFLALTVSVPYLNKKVAIDEPLKIPGCKSIRFEDIVDPILDQENQMFVEYVRMGLEIPLADGILVNTWEDLEPETLASLSREDGMLRKIVKSPVYPIGPIARSAEPGLKNHALDWLDGQQKESVLYVSFGSGGTLSRAQTIELAWGLELSQQRFIWVLRPPSDDDASAAFFTAGRRCDEAVDLLPDGFVVRTDEKGLVIPVWAPQVEIMAHPSVGGFLSHCGWNSTMECITNGLPMITWPLYAEQKMNATLLVEDLGMAVRSTDDGEVIARGEIEKTIRTIMEERRGGEVRARVKELQISARKALAVGGASYNSLAQISSHLSHRKKNHVKNKSPTDTPNQQNPAIGCDPSEVGETFK